MIFYHGDYFLPQITQISLRYSPSKRLFLPQIAQITRIHFFFFFDSLFDCVKCALRICTDFCLTAFVVFRHDDKRTWSFLTEIIFSHKLHKFHSFILPQTSFSPTDCTDNTDSFFSIRSLTASNAIYGFAQIFTLRHLFFLDMKTREHNLSHGNYFLPQITQISLLYSPSNVFFSHRLHR